MFIDGQNLYQRCRALFGHPLCHPHLLAEHLASHGPDQSIACRFYTGRPSSSVPREATKQRSLDRRLDVMRRCGVAVVTRPLSYHWEWSHTSQLPPARPGLPEQQVTLCSFKRGLEKSIDVAIALDVVEFALMGHLDVGIVVSLDRDLHEIPRTLRRLRGMLVRPVRLEAAVPVPDGLARPKILPGFSFTHQITRQVFEQVRDDTDYAVPAHLWVPPRALAASGRDCRTGG